MQIEIYGQGGLKHRRTLNYVHRVAQEKLQKFSRFSKAQFQLWLEENPRGMIECKMTIRRPHSKTVFIKKRGAEIFSALSEVLSTAERQLRKLNQRREHSGQRHLKEVTFAEAS